MRLIGLSLALLLFIPTLASALVINEINYNPPGNAGNEFVDREWIELYQESGCVNITKYWTISDNSRNRSLELMSGPSQLCEGDYAIAAKSYRDFLRAYPDYSGTLFNCPFQLADAGMTIVLRDSKGNTIDSVTYDPTWGANRNNKTLERSANSWFESLVSGGTPGYVNSVSQGNQNQQPPGAETPAANNPQQTIQQPWSVEILPEPAPVLPRTGNVVLSFVDPPKGVGDGSRLSLGIRLFSNFSIVKDLYVTVGLFSGNGNEKVSGSGTYTFVFSPKMQRTVEVPLEIGPGVEGAFNLRAQVSDGNSTWTSEVPITVEKAGPAAVPGGNEPLPSTAPTPTGAFTLNIDLNGVFGQLSALLTDLLDFFSNLKLPRSVSA